MGKKICLFLTVIMLVSCQQIDLSDFSDDSKARGQLTINCQFSQSFGDIDATRSTVVPVSDVATRLEYIIMQNGTVVDKYEQLKADDADEFGTFSTDLAPGTYNVVVFAHNALDSVRVSSTGLITSPSDRPTDSFSATSQITIGKDERTTASLQLSRCISRLVIDSKDVVPSTVNRMSLTIEGASTTFDGLSQCGYVTDPVLKEVSDISYVTNQTTLCFHLGTYLYLPQLISSADATINFLHYDQTTGKTDTVYKRILPQIQLRVNAQTTATATLFTTSGAGIQLAADKDWYTPITQDF